MPRFPRKRRVPVAPTDAGLTLPLSPRERRSVKDPVVYRKLGRLTLHPTLLIFR